MEFMALVRGSGKTQNMVGTENSKCKVPEGFALYALSTLVKTSFIQPLQSLRKLYPW